jgi:hypothetical protein
LCKHNLFILRYSTVLPFSCDPGEPKLNFHNLIKDSVP